MGWIEGVGWIDDNNDTGGDSNNTTPASQSPYAYNQSYDQPAQSASPYAWNQQQDQQQQPAVPSWGDIFGAAGGALNTGVNYNQQQQQTPTWDQVPSFNYNPETPFTWSDYSQQATPSDFYSQESRSAQPPPPTWDELPSMGETQQAYQDYKPDPFKSDGSVSSMYGQESQQPDYMKGYNGSPLYQGDRAYYAQQPAPDNSGVASWGDIPNNYKPDFNNANGTVPYVPQERDFANKPVLPYEQGYNAEQGSYSNPAAEFGPVATQSNNFDIGGYVGNLLSKQTPFIEQDPGKRLLDYHDYFDPEKQAEKVASAVPYILPGGLPIMAGITAAGLAAQGAVDSHIPGISNLGDVAQSLYGGVINPLLNFTPSIVGDIANGQVGPRNPYLDAAGLGKGQSGAQKVAQALDPNNAASMEAWRTQQQQADYAQQIAQGKSPQEASDHATQLGITLLNPLNYAEQSGIKEFSKLPAPVQLATQFLDPIGNKVFEKALAPALKFAPEAVKASMDTTALSNGIDNILENTVRAPAQRAFTFGQVADRMATTLAEAVDKINPEITATYSHAQVLGDFLKNPESPFYFQKVLPDLTPAKQRVIDEVTKIYDASPEAAITGKPATTTPAAGENIPASESKFGQQVQDTGQTPAPKAAVENPATTTPGIPAEPLDPKIAAENKASVDEFNAITADRTSPAEPVKLDDKYNAIQLPNKTTSNIDEFFGAAKTKQGIDVKALIPEPSGSGKTTLRPAKPLEEWGALGAAIRGVNKYTTVPLSRAYLESLSRYVRDPLGNVAKLAVEDPGAITQWVHDKLLGDKTNGLSSQYDKAIGGTVESQGPSGMTSDLEGKRSTNAVANLAYFAVNPINEALALGIRKATGGRFSDFNTGIEKRETAVKNVVYKRAALETMKTEAAKGPSTEFFQKNPELYKAAQGDTEVLKGLEDAISARTFKGFDVNDLVNKKFNPTMPGEGFKKEYPGVLDGTAGVYGDALNKGISSLPDRVKEYNDVQVLNYLHDTGVKLPKDMDLSKVSPKALANARAHVKELTLAELDSNHPLVQQMLADVQNANDATRLTLFPQDNRVYDLSNVLVQQGINYAADSRRFDLFGQSFKDAVAAREAGYAIKYKGPPTDFERMLLLKDRYESGAKMTKAEVAEYEKMRDSMPIRQQAADAGVELPKAEEPGMFEGATTPQDYLKIIKDGENFKSSTHDEFGGTPLTVAHQKVLAQALADGDRAAFDSLVSDIKKNPRYTEGVTGSGVYTDKSRANADRTINRLEQYWNEATDKGTGTASKGLPEATPQPKADYSKLYEAVHNPPAVKFDAGVVRGGKKFGNVLSPETMREMASKFNRKETFDSKGDTYNSETSRNQINRWFQDFVATDEYYRKVSNNQFKLDPATLSPVRIPDGISLEELMRKTPPTPIGPKVTSLEDVVKASGVPFDLKGTTIEQLGDLLKQAYGEKAMQDFTDMHPAEMNAIMQDVSRALFGVDPLNPLTNPKGSKEHEAATEMGQKYLKDMDARKAEYAQRVKEGKDLQDKFQIDMKKASDSFIAERFKLAYAAKEAGYKAATGPFFDYRNKNRIDQVLGTVLPFQYWARQNFAYMARYFAKNPYHFAALLNFYQNVEKQNSDPSIPSYAKFSLHMFDLPGGQHVMWDPTSAIPFNPLGNSDNFGGLTVGTTDSLTNAANDQPLGVFDPGALLFGKDKTNAQGQVYGRDKGVLANFIRPNPAIQDFLQTGIFNKWLGNIGVLGKDQSTFGQDYPEATRGQHERAGLIPGASQYRDFGAVTGITPALRNAGVIKGDLDVEGPINEALYGKNAGKSQTAIYQEINRMVVNKEISADQGKLAIAAYKDGSYKSVDLLAAMDRVNADNAGLRLASLVGFSAQLYNTPRQQATNKLYADENKAYAGDKTSVSKFFKDNPAASVLSTEQANDTPESIKQGIADDKTRTALNQLYDDRKAGKLDSKGFAVEEAKLQGENPVYFEKHPNTTTPDQQKYFETLDAYKAIGGDSFDKMQTEAYALRDKGDEAGFKKIITSSDYQAAQDKRNQFLIDNPDFYKQYSQFNSVSNTQRNAEGVGGLARTNPQLEAKPPKTIEDLKYGQDQSKFYSIGGARYDQLSKQVSDAFAKGDTTAAYAIENSREYKAMQAARDQYLLDNPSFASRYNADYTSKYGKPPTSDTDKAYNDLKGQYANIGGAKYDAMSQMVSDYMNAGDKKSAAVILGSDAYKQAKAARDQFLADNPDFAARYKAESAAKYGPTTTAAKTSTTASNGSSSTGSSSTTTAPWTAAQKSLYGKLLAQGYSKAAASSVVNKSSGGSTSTSSGSSTRKATSYSSKPFVPYTAAQKKAYAVAQSGGKSTSYSAAPKSSSTPLTASQKAVYAQAINSGLSSSAAYAKAAATKSTGTTTTPAAKTTTGTSTGSSSASSTTYAPYTAAQKKAYAAALVKKPGNLVYARAAARNALTGSTSGGSSAVSTKSTSSKTPVELTNLYPYNNGSSGSTIPRAVASTSTSSTRSVASLPVPKFNSGGSGGGGGGSRKVSSSSSTTKAPLISGRRLLPLPNRSLIMFNRRKRYK